MVKHDVASLAAPLMSRQDREDVAYLDALLPADAHAMFV